MDDIPARDKDDLDKTMHPLVVPVYEGLKAQAVTERDSILSLNRALIAHVMIDGRRVTCGYYLRRDPDGQVREQFEYYTYRYLHFKAV